MTEKLKSQMLLFKGVGWQQFRRLLVYFKPYLFWIVLGFICALIVAGTSGATAYLIKPAMDKIFTQTDRESALYWLKMLPFAVILLFAAKGLFRFLQNYILRVVGQKFICHIREELYQHYQRLSLDYYTATNTGVMMSRITNDVNMMERAVPNLTMLFREPISLLALAGVAFYMWWQMALIILVIFPLTAYPMVRFGKKVRKYTKRGQERMGELNTILKENFSGIRVIKAFGMEDYEAQRFNAENKRLYEANVKRVKFDELSSPVIEALASVAGALVIFYGGAQVINGQISSGEFFAFMGSLGLMYEPLKKINRVNVSFQSALAAGVRVFEVMDTVPSVSNSKEAVELAPFGREANFENVHFRYESTGEEVLRGIDLSAKAGQTIALVGGSGAGKTTLINLIPRFYETTAGRITLDGQDINEATLTSLRAQIAIVTQETFLFADSIIHNIAYGQETSDRERVVNAAQMANAHNFILSFPDGYDTQIGELGVKLSGGQRQRLAIARALYKDAPILILDEATSSLDSEAEREVQHALENLMRGRTTFVIAHRLSTVRRADRILVLNEGRIVEDGCHDDLIKQDGEYAHLYNMQFQDED